VLEVIYEELLDSPNRIISCLTRELIGHALAPDLDAIGLGVQRDQLNRELKAAFLHDLTNLAWNPV